MFERKSANMINGEFPEDFINIKFKIKYKFIEIFFYSSEFVHALPISPRQLAKMLNGLFLAAQKLESPVCALDLHMVNDGQMAFFNFRYMQRMGPTNILSFPGGVDMMGSLVLSLQTLVRESRLYGQDLQDYLLHLLCHGLAHLAGFEHGEEMEEFVETLKMEYSFFNELPA